MSEQSVLELAVVRYRGGWKVVGPAGSWRLFEFRIDAEEAALRLMTQERRRDVKARVLVQSDFGELSPLVAVGA